MAQVYVVGRVVADLELKQSSRDESYVCFDIAENIGGRDSRRKQTLQIWAFGSDAKQLIRDGVQGNTSIWVKGYLELEKFQQAYSEFRYVNKFGGTTYYKKIADKHLKDLEDYEYNSKYEIRERIYLLAPTGRASKRLTEK